MNTYESELRTRTCGLNCIRVEASIRCFEDSQAIPSNPSVCLYDPKVKFVASPGWLERLFGATWEGKIEKAQQQVLRIAEREIAIFKQQEKLLEGLKLVKLEKEGA